MARGDTGSDDRLQAEEEYEFVRQFWKAFRWLSSCFAMLAVSIVLEEWLTGPAVRMSLLACQGLAILLFMIFTFKLLISPGFVRLRKPLSTGRGERQGVPSSPEVQRHQRRVEGDPEC